MIRHLTRPMALCAASFFLSLQIAAAQEWALDGFDPVAYSRDSAAVSGRSDIVTQWHGKIWHFTSEAHRDLFEADPRAFTPGFDGLCPVSLSEGRREAGDPRFFMVIEGRTYLARDADARDQLHADPRNILEKAKARWRELRR